MSAAAFWYGLKLTRFSQPATDRPLYRAMRGRRITSVVEVGMGDGVRTERMLDWLKRQGNQVHWYAGLGAFEAGGANNLSLKEAHRWLVRAGVRPLLVPGSTVAGLMRVAHTVGAVDLVVVAENWQELADPAAAAILPRLLQPQTLVLAATEAGQPLRAIDPATMLSAAPQPGRLAA